jgi:glutathione synthase
MNEKVFTAWFPQCCAPTLITRNAADITAFATEHGKIVVKPLDGMGGKSIFVTEKGDKNLPVIIETLTDNGQRFAIAQRYVPDIAMTGDSRVLLIDGEPVPYALARIRCRPTTAEISPPAPRASVASSTIAIGGWRRKSARRSPSRGWCSSAST